MVRGSWLVASISRGPIDRFRRGRPERRPVARGSWLALAAVPRTAFVGAVLKGGPYLVARGQQLAAVPWTTFVGAVLKGGPALLLGELSAQLTERLIGELRPTNCGVSLRNSHKRAALTGRPLRQKGLSHMRQALLLEERPFRSHTGRGFFCMEFYFAIRLATLLAKATGSSGMMPSRSSA